MIISRFGCAGVALALLSIPLYARSAAPPAPPVQQILEQSPLPFESHRPGAFLSRGAGYAFELSPSGATFSVGAPGTSPVRLSFPGASRNAILRGEAPLPGRVNYLRGSDPARWRRNLPTFGRVVQRGLYPGIDLIYYGNQRQLEFDFRVAPGADPKRIRLSFAGASGLRIDDAGDLLLATAAGEIRQHKPLLYQERAGRRVEIPGRYRMAGPRTVAVDVGAYDPDAPLVVDPVLSYSSYLGGSRTDSGIGVALDAAGNIFVAGNTNSPNFTVTSGVVGNGPVGGQEMFVTKFNSKGAVVYSTYIAGGGSDVLTAMTADAAGNVYVTAYTDSSNLPRVRALQGNNRGGYYGLDAYVAKLDPNGAEFVYATYLGGNDDELVYGIAADASGNAYVTGTTASTNFPVSLVAYQKLNKGILSGFITKIDSTGTLLSYSTYYGGSRTDIPGGITVDKAGNVYVVGDTTSTDFPTTTGAYQTTHRGGNPKGSGTDIFLLKMNISGTALVYSTLLGGSDDDVGAAVAVDDAGNAYIGGRTSSTNFPTTSGVLQRELSGPEDAYVAKFNPAGTAMLYGTLLGGTRQERVWGILADAAGNAYVGGMTSSSGFPLQAGFQTEMLGDSDGFVVKLDPTGSKVLQGSLLGGSGAEGVYSIARDAAGNIYVTGQSTSNDFPVTSSAAQVRYGGNNGDGFLSKLDFSDATLALTVAPARLTFQGQANSPVAVQRLTLSCMAGARVNWTAEVVTAGGGNWLSLGQRSGTAPGVLDVLVNTTSLAAGSYGGIITILNPATGGKTAVDVALTLAPPRRPDRRHALHQRRQHAAGSCGAGRSGLAHRFLLRPRHPGRRRLRCGRPHAHPAGRYAPAVRRRSRASAVGRRRPVESRGALRHGGPYQRPAADGVQGDEVQPRGRGHRRVRPGAVHRQLQRQGTGQCRKRGLLAQFGPQPRAQGNYHHPLRHRGRPE